LPPGCVDESGSGDDGISCDVGNEGLPQASDVAAALRVNDGANPDSFFLRSDIADACLSIASGEVVPVAGDNFGLAACTGRRARWYVGKRHNATNMLINDDGRVCVSGFAGGGTSTCTLDQYQDLEILNVGWSVQIKVGGLCLRVVEGGTFATGVCDPQIATQLWRRYQ